MAEHRCVRGGVEKMAVTVHPSAGAASAAVAAEIAALIRERAKAGRQAVLGLATGSTPCGVYEELVRLHVEEGLSFSNVVTFNLDEYWPIQPGELQSYHRFMNEYLFDHIDIDRANVHVPDGTLPIEDVGAYCDAYEAKIAEAGGIDIQVLGIGRTGHIGFNEPGSGSSSRTRLITLDRMTRIDAASDFYGEWNVPRRAITMGVGTILDARRVVMLAFGEHKAPIIQEAVEGEITPVVAASFLQQHPDARVVLDPAAAAQLTRFKTPWLAGPVSDFGLEWNTALTRRAVIWLAQTVDKPILKLTAEDYNECGLQELISVRGTAYEINIEVFKTLQKTITGWPGGKTGRPKFVAGRGIDKTQPSDTFPKRVVVFSPHPDDDVISMGGTFIRLCDQGHEVHVAYQTSGNIAVFDAAAERHADFVEEFCSAFGIGEGAERAGTIAHDIRQFLRTKETGAVDTPELRAIKGLIRRTEARAGAKFSGVSPEHIHFLDMPFYETGKVKKKPLGEDDIQIILELLDRVKPQLVYAAGDLSDPHGTHRTCLASITTAFHRMQDRPWMSDCELWLYRGAWQEWGAEEIEMAVPLSPDEVERKRVAIFKHESQKDKALYPGSWDTREFWQRAEDRNRATAEVYDNLGLPEYQAIEGFVKWRPSEADGSLEHAGKRGQRAGAGQS
jgi:glucosamine-6-phosphate deaminase